MEDNKVQEFFCAAVSAAAQKNDMAACTAALVAASESNPDNRAGLAGYVLWLDVKHQQWGYGVGVARIIGSAENLEDREYFTERLKNEDSDYWLAWTQRDPTVFHRRYPDLTVLSLADQQKADAATKGIMDDPRVQRRVAEEEPELYAHLASLGVVKPVPPGCEAIPPALLDHIRGRHLDPFLNTECSGLNRLRPFRRFVEASESVTDYFLLAATAWICFEDRAACLAALAMATTINKARRIWMLRLLESFASPFEGDHAGRAAELISMIRSTAYQTVGKRRELSKLDRELWRAMSNWYGKADPDVFVRRYGQLQPLRAVVQQRRGVA
jgi:hypothetical protein